MFRMIVFIEDKNLVRALTALSGVAARIETPQPIVNINGSEPGRARDLFLRILKAKTFKPNDLRVFLPTIGCSERSVSTVIDQMLKAKQIRRKSQGLYEVLK